MKEKAKQRKRKERAAKKKQQVVESGDNLDFSDDDKDYIPPEKPKEPQVVITAKEAKAIKDKLEEMAKRVILFQI